MHKFLIKAFFAIDFITNRISQSEPRDYRSFYWLPYNFALGNKKPDFFYVAFTNSLFSRIRCETPFIVTEMGNTFTIKVEFNFALSNNCLLWKFLYLLGTKCMLIDAKIIPLLTLL